MMEKNPIISVFENPFRASRIQPGAIPYIFPDDVNAEVLVERLRQNDWRGEITGPHGSGKSTLLETLTPAIERAGRSLVLVVLHDGQRRLPRASFDDPRLQSPAVLAIDGYEQLSFFSRWTLKRFCRRRRLGLLVTAHRSMGFPPIFQTPVETRVAQQVVDRLLEGRSPPFTSEEVSRCFCLHHGDLRETLFALYDIYEDRRPSSGKNVN